MEEAFFYSPTRISLVDEREWYAPILNANPKAWSTDKMYSNLDDNENLNKCYQENEIPF